MNLATIIAAVREFFLEFLGYLLPGAAFLLLIYFFIPDEIFASYASTSHSLLGSYQVYIFLIMSYLSGYMLYGISKIKASLSYAYNRLIKTIQKVRHKEEPLPKHIKRAYRKCMVTDKFRIDREIIQSEEFEMTCQILRNILDIPEGEHFPKNQQSKFYIIRNLAISYIPEADLKIATFTFRSELAEHVSAMTLFVGLIGLVCTLVPPEIAIFHHSPPYLVLYLLLLVAAYLLHQTHIRMLRISKKIVFPIFIAKYYRSKQEHSHHPNGRLITTPEILEQELFD